METNAKRVGKMIAKTFGEEAFFATRVDFEKAGTKLNCDPALVELVNTILNQHGYEYMYAMVEDNQFITMDECNATGEYTPLPQSMETLCKRSIDIIDQALAKCVSDTEDITTMISAKCMIENYLEEMSGAAKLSDDLLDFAEWVSDCAVDDPRYYGHAEVLINEWKKSRKRNS